MLSTSAFERDLWNWFAMSSSPLAPPFTLQMLILGGFLEVSSNSEANNDTRTHQRIFSECSTPLLSNATFGNGLPCLVHLWHSVYTANIDFWRFSGGLIRFLKPIMAPNRIKRHFLNALHLCFRTRPWNWFRMSSSPLAPCFTLQMIILGGFLEVFF